MADLKTRLNQLLDLSHSFQQQLIADLDPVERDATGTWEDWSVKDELAHVIAWQSNSLARLAALVHAEPMPDFNDHEAINQAIYRTNHGRSLAEIAAEGERAHADFIALIQSLSEEDLARPARFTDQETRSLALQIIGNSLDHPVVHYADYHRRRGRLARATQLHEASVAAVADWPERYGVARYNLACFYALSGQSGKAIAELQEALQLRPDLLEWSRQDTDLASLHDDPDYQALYQA